MPERELKTSRPPSEWLLGLSEGGYGKGVVYLGKRHFLGRKGLFVVKNRTFINERVLLTGGSGGLVSLLRGHFEGVIH